MKKKRTASQVGKFSRRKGKSFERWCARYFTQWTGLKWETTRNSGRTDLKGDIYCLSRPDLPLVVECKHRKEYSVHAMLKPTEAFTKMVRRYGSLTMIIVKNETGIWVHYSPSLADDTISYSLADTIFTKRIGLTWSRLEHIVHKFNIDGVIFDASGMDSASKKGEG